VRLPVSVALVALACLAVRDQLKVRDFEAWLASKVIAVGAHVQTGYFRNWQAVWFPENPHLRLALVITPACTVALLMAPFLVAAALLIWQRVPLRWPLIAVAVALVMLVAVNQFRLLAIVWFVRGLGYQKGFYWGHTMVGSVITIVGLATSLGVFVVLSGRHRYFRPRRADQSR
jgi:exosortase/archaeosortase family protein